MLGCVGAEVDRVQGRVKQPYLLLLKGRAAVAVPQELRRQGEPVVHREQTPVQFNPVPAVLMEESVGQSVIEVALLVGGGEGELGAVPSLSSTALACSMRSRGTSTSRSPDQRCPMSL